MHGAGSRAGGRDTGLRSSPYQSGSHWGNVGRQAAQLGYFGIGGEKLLDKASLNAVKWRRSAEERRGEGAMWAVVLNTPGGERLLDLCHPCHVEFARQRVQLEFSKGNRKEPKRTITSFIYE